MGAITRGIANNILGNGAVDGTDALTGTIPATNIGNPSLANLTTFPPSVDAGIPQVAGDPPAPSDGDVWYNTNTYKLRVRGVSAAAGSWATGGNLNTGRNNLQSAQYGTQTAALAFGAGNPVTGATESYDGTSWTEVNDLNSARGVGAGAGTQSSALMFGGDPNVALTETWNGTSWTEVSDLNQGRNGIGGAGIDNTSVLCFGGQDFGTNTETWNGTSWTEVNNLNTFRRTSGWGTQTSAIAAGGFSDPLGPPKNVAVTESWNGTSWTEVNDLNTTRSSAGTLGTDNTSGLAIGGNIPPAQSVTESWNGTSWTEVGDLSTARTTLRGAGTSSSGLAFGGDIGGGVSAATEEWNAGAANLNVDLA